MTSAIKQLTLLQKITCLRSLVYSRRMLSIPVPSADPTDVIISPKIENLVREITKLTLLEVSELNNALKKTLNLPDVTPAAFGVAHVAPTQEQEVVQEIAKSSYTLKLIKYDNTKRTALIKEVKTLLEDMNLVQAKKFIESAPVIVKADIGKEEAEKLKEALAKHGAECTID